MITVYKIFLWQVGSLEALYLAKRGHRVRLYEYREGEPAFSHVPTVNKLLIDTLTWIINLNLKRQSKIVKYVISKE